MRFSMQNNLGYWANRLANAMWADLSKELADLDATPAQWGVMGLLADDGPMGVVELARRKGIDRAAASRHVAQLEKKGLVKRLKHPKDSRQVLLELTTQGQDLMPELQERSIRVNDQWLTHLEPEEAEQLLTLLQKSVGQKQPKFF